MNDTILLSTGMNILVEHLGLVEAERFVYLVNKEHSNYTEFRHTLFDGMSLDDLCREAALAKQEAALAKQEADERMKNENENA